ncbi:MAG: hypothetical protein VX527_07335 [Planctomycetota bacterium]|nr:hypothetical protein [Planctomycetota bacterium]
MTSALIFILWTAAGIAPGDSVSNTNATQPTTDTVEHASNDHESALKQAQDRTDEAVRRLRDEGLSKQAPSEVLWEVLVDTYSSMLSLRREIAQIQLNASSLQNQLDELRQFILDHETYGPDYAAYTKMLEETRRQGRAAALREKREQDEAKRKTREEVRQRMDAAKDQNELERMYDERGFGPIGQNVYTSRSAFFYGPRQGEDGKEIQYRPSRFGRIQAVTIPSNRELDYSVMTISGSVLNGGPEIRNIGIAITFFDEHGNQVGAEIVEIENARPNVPYPFTRKIVMALNRPFATHSSYVLYADQVVIP